MFSEVKINVSETEEVYGYRPDELAQGSHNKVVVECLNCQRLIHREYRNVTAKHQCPVVEGTNKKCHKCGHWKDLSFFNKNRSIADGYSKMCRECFNNHDSVIACEKRRRHRQRMAVANGDIEYYIRNRDYKLRSNCKRKGIVCDVGFDFLLNLWNQQCGRCYYTGLPMVASMSQEGFQTWDSPSLDRKTPSLGYTKENLCWCIFSVNSFKQSLDETSFKKSIQKIQWWYQEK